MPNITLVIPETKQSVMRPVVLAIVRQVRDITSIPTSTVISFPDESERVYQPGSAISEDPTETTLFPHNDRVVIEVDEEYDASSILSTAVTKPEQLPIFHDSKIGIFIKPVYSKTNVTINFKYKAKSRSEANRWRDSIRMRFSTSRDINLHKVSYHYVIPPVLVYILRETHRLREANGGYGEDFSKYLLDNTTERLTQVTNLSASVVQDAISETQMRIVGYFDFDFAPDKITDEGTDLWVGQFSYKFSFEKPIACNMTYPAMIHNQILTTKWRPAEKSYDVDDQLQTYSLSSAALNTFERQLEAEKYVNFKANIVLPYFDEFIPTGIPTGTVSIFSALCQIVPTDLKSLLNLKDLDTIAIDSDIMDFIQNCEYPFMTGIYTSVLHVALYRSMSLASDKTISITKDLDVKALHDLSIRTSHRIRLSVVADLSLVKPEAITRLRKYPKAFAKIIASINEAIRNNPNSRDLAGIGTITENNLFGYIRTASERTQFNTVQTSYLVAMRSDNKT